jgi:hypothetical protein
MTDNDEWRIAPSEIPDMRMVELRLGTNTSGPAGDIELNDQGKETFSDTDELDELQWALAYDESEPLPDLAGISASLALPRTIDAKSLVLHPAVTSVRDALPAADIWHGARDAAFRAVRGVVNDLLLGLSWEARPMRPALRKTLGATAEREPKDLTGSSNVWPEKIAPPTSFKDVAPGILLTSKIELHCVEERVAATNDRPTAIVVITMLRPTEEAPLQFRASLLPSPASEAWHWLVNVQIRGQGALNTRGMLSSERKACYLAGDRFSERIDELTVEISFEAAHESTSGIRPTLA